MNAKNFNQIQWKKEDKSLDFLNTLDESEKKIKQEFVVKKRELSAEQLLKLEEKKKNSLKYMSFDCPKNVEHPRKFKSIFVDLGTERERVEKEKEFKEYAYAVTSHIRKVKRLYKSKK